MVALEGTLYGSMTYSRWRVSRLAVSQLRTAAVDKIGIYHTQTLNKRVTFNFLFWMAILSPDSAFSPSVLAWLVTKGDEVGWRQEICSPYLKLPLQIFALHSGSNSILVEGDGGQDALAIAVLALGRATASLLHPPYSIWTELHLMSLWQHLSRLNFHSDVH